DQAGGFHLARCFDRRRDVWGNRGACARTGSRQRSSRPQTCQRGVLRMPLVVKSPGLSTNRDATTCAAIANTKGVTRTALFAMLQTSHKEMPNLVIKGDDAQNIIAYILSLKGGD